MTDTSLTSLGARKQALRRLIRERKSEHDLEARACASLLITERLEQLTAFREAQTVLLYHSLPDEVQTGGLLERWWQAKRLLLPVVEGDDLVLVAYRPDALRCGAFGILEPTGEPFADYEAIDLALVPGMAFDAEGNRLGRGRGFYDRLLPRIEAPLIGLAFSWQMVGEVPVEPHDRRVDAVVTDRELILPHSTTHPNLLT
jgi:5-formyltetrahydrofolate cyclo-ligase